MYAIIETGGKQYKVAPGERLRIEKLEAEKGATVSFNNVVLFNNGEEVTVDSDRLSKITVTGTVMEQDRGKKILVYKSKRRKNYKRQYGHRQSFTAVKIEAIEG